MSGPCVVCGATDYSPSFGGPSICPACDCGTPAVMTPAYSAIVAESARLRASNAALIEALKDAEAFITIAVPMYKLDREEAIPLLARLRAALASAEGK